MKLLHRPDMYGWSQFDESRNIDFNSVLWVRKGGNLVVDPLPLTPHDFAHLEKLGGAQHIIVTNSDHIRDTQNLRRKTGAKVYAPAAEQGDLPIWVDDWLSAGDAPLPGVHTLAMSGSKTPGELALLIEATTLITGDLIRAHLGGQLDLLPPAKLKNVASAIESVRKLSQLDGIIAVLTGDGWPAFHDGTLLLRELVARLDRSDAP